MKKQATSRDCYTAALQLLGRRDHSCSELSGKLAGKGFSQEEIKTTVDRCLRHRYLDDERFAEIYIKQLQHRGYGCRRIKQMLTAKAVAHQIISACLAPFCRDAVQIRDCRNAMAKKLKNSQHTGDSAQSREKLYRFLLNRGFSPAIIRQVMDEGVE